MMDDEQRRLHWRRTTRLMLAGLLVCVFLLACVFLERVAPRFGLIIESRFFLRFPLAYFIAAHVVVVALIALIYWFNGKQEELDRRHGINNEF